MTLITEQTDADQSTSATVHDPNPRWTAVIQRDASADETFVYAVKTTGIYCRPSCASRRAKPINVSFYDTCEAAEEAGFRPCMRCRPNEASRAKQHADAVADACRFIEIAEEAPSLDEIAKAAGMSPYHFHRIFKATTGLTPKAYATAHRAKRVRNGLGDGAGTVTEAIYDAGFNSSSRFYAKADEMLGMTPKSYRDGGRDTEIRFAIGESSLGAILVAATPKGVCAIDLGDDPETLASRLQDRFPNAKLIGNDASFSQLVAQVVGLIEAPGLGKDLPLDMRGTAFQQRVWLALRDIPPGQTASYAEIARRIGAPSSARAVAQACASNTIAVAIPCHRVVRTGGALSGYRWGVERKRALLAKEARS